MTYQDIPNSPYISESLSSLSQSRSSNSLIVRSYKQARNFYLTKRFKDALETIDPVVRPRQAGDASDGSSSTEREGCAPIAQTARATRVKVWVFYLSLLHAIVELGSEEGRTLIGATRWKELATSARDGTIWEDVVRNGYYGKEGAVDAEVIVNLATLLLGHMPSQKLNQQRVESYLTSSDTGGYDGQLFASAQDGVSTPMSNASSSPKTLQTRLKILELYSLHILPANDEWEYAQSFIELSGLLDEERKEAFLNALSTLKDDRDGTVHRARELEEQRQREMLEQKRSQEDAIRAEEERKQEQTKNKQTHGRSDITSQQPPDGRKDATPSRPPRKPPVKPKDSATRQAKGTAVAHPLTFYQHASLIFSRCQRIVMEAGEGMTLTNIALIRSLALLFAFLLLITRQDLRIKLKRLTARAWEKIRQTTGMAMKVSYV